MQANGQVRMLKFLGIERLFNVWQGNLGLAHTSIVIIVELIERILHHTLLSTTVQVGSIIVKRIKVLRDTRYQRLETRIRFGASSVGKKKKRMAVS